MGKTPCSSFTEEVNNGDSYGKSEFIKCTQLFCLLCFDNTDFKAIDGIPGKSIRQCPFEKMLLPKYQSNNIDNIVSLPAYSVTFSNLPRFNRSFFSVDLGFSAQKSCQKLSKTSEATIAFLPS